MLKTMQKYIIMISMLTLPLQAENIAAYLKAPYQSLESTKSTLTDAGFEILTIYAPAKKEHLNVLLFTSKKLQELATKNHQGFAAIQRIMIDTKNKTLRVTNPHYWLRAFLPKSFDENEAQKLKRSLHTALGEFTPTKDVLDEKDIASYHFAISMPYYHDRIKIKSAKNLLQKVNKKKKLFQLDLADGSTLIAVKMSKNAEGYIDTIGEENAIALPYTLLIKEDTAYALAPKYYLAISNPLLSLGEFMKISSTPDAIVRKLKKVFK